VTPSLFDHWRRAAKWVDYPAIAVEWFTVDGSRHWREKRLYLQYTEDAEVLTDLIESKLVEGVPPELLRRFYLLTYVEPAGASEWTLIEMPTLRVIHSHRIAADGSRLS